MEVKEGNEVIAGSYLGFAFRVTKSGGKAGKGHNKTSSYYVYHETLATGKYFSFTVNDRASMREAIRKAKIWIYDTLVSKGICPNCGDNTCTSDHK
jgi:hypothetical protein